jgi:DNA repair protein RadD
MADRYSIFHLLEAYAETEALIDERVSRTVGALVQDGQLRRMPAPSLMAMACLGDPISAVRRLAAAGVLPDELPQEQRQALAARLSVHPVDLSVTTVLNNLDRVAVFLGLPETRTDRVAELPPAVVPIYGLFRHQRRAVAEAHATLARGRTRLLLHMPTGSGKTRTTLSLVCDYLRANEGRPVLWFASTRELLDQAVSEFHRAWAALGNREVEVATAWGGRDWRPDEPRDGILVASLQTVHARQAEPGFIPSLGRRVGLIVFDEAHQAIAPTYRQVATALSNAGQPITPIVGLSATPGRTFAGSVADDDLAEFFDHTKIELDTSGDGGPANPVEFLIREGYLARPEFRLLGDIPDEDAEPTNDVDDLETLGMGQDDYLGAVVTATLDLVKASHRRIIVFAASVELAHVIAATLRAAGVLADAVDGTTAAEVRDTAIRMYKAPAPVPRVLVNYGVLTTGFDAPKTSAVVIARPTRSLVLYSQMVGRGIRGPKAGGNEKAVVVTVVDPSVPAFGSIAAAFTHWEEMW